MSDLELAKSNPKKQLFDQIEKVSAGMLGLEDSPQHFQPMAPQVDRVGNRIWFFSKKSSDLVKSLGGGRKAHFVVVGSGHDYHACIGGTLQENRDPDKIKEYWSSIVAAWFDGKDDPDMTLLEFTPNNAAVWASLANPVVFAWEIAKANVTGNEPDAGVKTEVQFA